ncbi:hypothetical protein APHAL10511_004645 [Amanita phalloides]|nr:hypothetical protein APHAL10511_004645 [Amanita phalloides]
MSYLPPRAPFYLLAFVPPLWLMSVAPIVANRPGPTFLGSVAFASSIFAASSWIWIAILLCYSNTKPTASLPLARSDVHIASFLILSVLWLGTPHSFPRLHLHPTLGIGILMATQTAIECRLHVSRCSTVMFCVALALLTSIFSFVCAAIVYTGVVVAGSRFSIHVAQPRHMALEGEL